MLGYDKYFCCDLSSYESQSENKPQRVAKVLVSEIAKVYTCVIFLFMFKCYSEIFIRVSAA